MQANPIFVATFNVEESRLAEFEDWYRKRHVPDGLSIPHFQRLFRYEKWPGALPLLDSGPRFLNIYVVDSPDNVEAAWLSKQREDSSQDFFRWADALRDGIQGIYLPTAVVEKEDRMRWVAGQTDR